MSFSEVSLTVSSSKIVTAAVEAVANPSIDSMGPLRLLSSD